MELDELKSAWSSVNKRLDEMLKAQLILERTVRQGHTKTAASSLKTEPIIELIVAALAALWSGGFLADNIARVLATPVGAIPGALTFGVSILTVVLSVWQLTIISGLDFSKSIVEAQSSLAALRLIRVRSTQFMLLIGIPFWFIFPLFPLQAMVGYENSLAIGSKFVGETGNWVVANLALGVLLSIGFVVAARLWGEQSRFFRAINEALAGSAVKKAQKLLDDVQGFAQT